MLTNGSGNPARSTLFYNLYLYQNAFKYFHMGYAAALTLVFLVFVLIFSVVQTFALDRRVHY